MFISLFISLFCYCYYCLYLCSLSVCILVNKAVYIRPSELSMGKIYQSLPSFLVLHRFISIRIHLSLSWLLTVSAPDGRFETLCSITTFLSLEPLGDLGCSVSEEVSLGG